MYTNWVCSGEAHGQILRFPSLSDIPQITLDGNDSINTKSEESYDDSINNESEESKMYNFGLNGDSSASYFDVKINAISFILGSFVGALFVYFSAFRSAQS